MANEQDKGTRSIVLLSQSGCLLPFLILSNLFFGWIIYGFIGWLVVGGILILLFWLNAYILARHISRQTSKRENVIDVEGEVIEDRQKLR